MKILSIHDTHRYRDGLIICRFDNNRIRRFGGYLCTIDLCLLPPFDKIDLAETPKRSLTIPNAGGSSEISEALSMQYMHDRFGANEFIPEKEVDYWIEYKMCDYIMVVNGVNVGVSVTRAVSYPFTNEFSYVQAASLLNKKLNGLIIARNAVNERHQFFMSILHIWCHTALAAQNLRKAYDYMINHDTDKVYNNIYIICTICPVMYIYTNHLTPRIN